MDGPGDSPRIVRQDAACYLRNTGTELRRSAAAGVKTFLNPSTTLFPSFHHSSSVHSNFHSWDFVVSFSTFSGKVVMQATKV